MRRWSLLVASFAVSALFAGCVSLPDKGVAKDKTGERLSLPSPSGIRAAAVACVESLKQSGVLENATGGHKPVVAVANMGNTTWWDVDTVLFAHHCRMELLRSNLALSTTLNSLQGKNTALGVPPDFTLCGKITVEQRRNVGGVPVFPRFVARMALTDVKTGFVPWEEIIPIKNPVATGEKDLE